MKTKFVQTNKKFQPIEFTLTLETPEDLKNFLILTSVMSDSNSYSEDLPDVELTRCAEKVDERELAWFVDNMLTSTQWQQLRQIYVDSIK